MLSAAIDVGSNTIRTLIGLVRDKEVQPTTTPKNLRFFVDPVFYDRTVTRLAEGLKETGYLRDANMEASIKVLTRISDVISRYDVKVIRAVGTEALRRSGNAWEFIDRVFSKTGIKIKIITEEEEARLTLRGVLTGLDVASDCLIIDMGGGSTEWIIYAEGPDNTIFGSMPIGVVSLYEGHIKGDPPSTKELNELDSFIESPIRELRKQTIGREIKHLIGTGGTVTTLASIDQTLDSYRPDLIHGYRLNLNRLKDIRDRLISIPISLRRAVKGLEPERADLIIPGIIFTIKIMEIFKFNELIVSDYGLLEGLLLEGGRDEKGL